MPLQPLQKAIEGLDKLTGLTELWLGRNRITKIQAWDWLCGFEFYMLIENFESIATFIVATHTSSPGSDAALHYKRTHTSLTLTLVLTPLSLWHFIVGSGEAHEAEAT